MKLPLAIAIAIVALLSGCCCQPKVWPATYSYDNPGGLYPPKR